jgi:ABC-type dipeptide/oligopeptide/nickel transport system permease subunit
MNESIARGQEEGAAPRTQSVVGGTAPEKTRKPGQTLAQSRIQAPGMGRLLVRELLHDWLSAASLAFLLFIVILALAAPLIAPYSPHEQSLSARLDPPTRDHIMGTDDLGRDTFSRLLYGARVSLFIAVTGTLGAVLLGTFLGLVSGFFGGWTDECIMRVVDVTFAFPGVLFAILIVSVLGPGLWNLVIALVFFGAPTLSRIVRGSVLSLKQQDFVEASRSMGAGPSRIIFRHILVNCVAPIIVYLTLGIAISILIAAGLGFLGLGAQPPTPEWGAMLSDARKQMRLSPWMSIFPGTAIFLTVLALNIIGDSARDALDPFTPNRAAARQGRE